MKKIFPLLFVFCIFAGCSQSSVAPTLSDNFSANAKIMVGTFSYSATINWHKNKAFVTANTTNAKGLSISCDGEKLTYSYDKFIKTGDINNVSIFNPALILYQVFSDNVPINKVDDEYKKIGVLPAGKYELTICENGLPQTLLIDKVRMDFKNP